MPTSQSMNMIHDVFLIDAYGQQYTDILFLEPCYGYAIPYSGLLLQ